MYYNQVSFNITTENNEHINYYCIAKFPTLTLEITFTMYTVLISYVLPLTTIIFCYARMMLKIIKNAKNLLSEDSKITSPTNFRNRNQENQVCLLIWLFIILFKINIKKYIIRSLISKETITVIFKEQTHSRLKSQNTKLHFLLDRINRLDSRNKLIMIKNSKRLVFDDNFLDQVFSYLFYNYFSWKTPLLTIEMTESYKLNSQILLIRETTIIFHVNLLKQLADPIFQLKEIL